MNRNLQELVCGDMVTLRGRCVFTGEDYAVSVMKRDWDLYKTGSVLAQNVFPQLSPDDREFLISGISPNGWKLQFGDDN